MSKSSAKVSPHFFVRDQDRSVRIRIRLTEEEADMIEEAAGDTPLIAYIHRALEIQAQSDIAQSREKMNLPNPEG